MKLNLYEALTGKSQSNPVISMGDFVRNLEKYASNVTDNFVLHGEDLNESIAKIAKMNSLNNDQIQRVVEESNNQVYLRKYASMKNSTDRDVEFPVASLEKVLSICDINTEKVASVKPEKMNSFNYSPYKTGALGAPDTSKLIELIAKRSEQLLKTASADLNKATDKFNSHIYKIAEMMIRYDRSGTDINSIYKDMCKEAKLNSVHQSIIQSAVDEVINQEKLANMINSKYELKLEYTNPNEKEKDFSLGEFSGIKKYASTIPTMQFNDVVISTVSDLIDFAKQLNPLFEKTANAKYRLEKIEKMTTFAKDGE